MNRTFFRYIAAGFWAPFGFGLTVFCLLLTFGSLFDSLNFFIRSGAGPWVFAKYVLFQVPYFVVKMAPIATLLAVLFSLGAMMSRGEWKAGLAGGWRPLDMIKPLLACALLVGAGQFLLQETVAPDLYLRSTHLYEQNLRGREDWQRLVKKNVTFSAGEGTFVTASLFDGLKKTMSGVVADFYADGRLSRELNAAAARWDGEGRRWIFTSGVKIDYEGDSPRSIARFPEYVSEVSVPPEDLVLERLVPDGVSIPDVRARIARLKAVGAPSGEERTLFWVQLFSPLAAPVMALIGAAMAMFMGRGNRLYSVGFSVGFGFFFWSMLIMGQEAGSAGMVPPFLAGLLPVLVFAAASFWALRKARAL